MNAREFHEQVMAEGKRLHEEHEEKVRRAFQRFQTDALFHARVHRVAMDLFQHGDIPEPDSDLRHELALGLALRAVVAYEATAQELGLT